MVLLIASMTQLSLSPSPHGARQSLPSLACTPTRIPAGQPSSGAIGPSTAGSGSRSNRPGSIACRPARRVRRCARTWLSIPRPKPPKRRAFAPASAASRATGRPSSASASRSRAPARCSMRPTPTQPPSLAEVARKVGLTRQHAQQALRGRARRDAARLAGRAQARALPQGAARGREGRRGAVRRGLRLAEPRLRDRATRRSA